MLTANSYLPENLLQIFGEGDREPSSGSWWWGFLLVAHNKMSPNHA